MDPRVYSAALYMQQQQQQLAAMHRMNLLAQMQGFNPALMAQQQHAALLEAALTQKSSARGLVPATEDLSAAGTREDQENPQRRSSAKRRRSDMTKSQGEQGEDLEDIDVPSMLLTTMLSSSSPISSPSSPDKKEGISSLANESNERTRKSRRLAPSLSVDVDSPTDPVSADAPSSPSVTSPPSPDSFEDKYDSSSPFHGLGQRCARFSRASCCAFGHY